MYVNTDLKHNQGIIHQILRFNWFLYFLIFLTLSQFNEKSLNVTVIMTHEQSDM